MHINWEYLNILFDYNYQFLSVEAGKKSFISHCMQFRVAS